MPVEEQEEFSLYLHNAIEDLINARPKDPTKYLAIALLRQIPEQDWSGDFPEIVHEVRQVSESPSRIDSARAHNLDLMQDRDSRTNLNSHNAQPSNRRPNI